MAFMEAYKRLDNLCKDLFSSDVGITEYIKSMERCSHYTLYIDNWRNDYFALSIIGISGIKLCMKTM